MKGREQKFATARLRKALKAERLEKMAGDRNGADALSPKLAYPNKEM